MDIKKIQALIKRGESPSLEFKTTTNQIKAAFETVCAFLNDAPYTYDVGLLVSEQSKLIYLF